MSIREKIIIYSAYEYDTGKKVCRILTEKNEFRTVFFNKKFISDVEPFVYGEIFYKNEVGQNPTSFYSIERFENITDNFEKFVLISFFFELLNKMEVDDERIFSILKLNLSIINKNINNVNNKLYLLYILSLCSILSGYMHLTEVCPICSKEFSGNAFFVSERHCFVCSNHKSNNRYSVNENFLNYLKILRVKYNHNVILPKIDMNEIDKYNRFFDNFYTNIFENKKPNIFKFIKYI